MASFRKSATGNPGFFGLARKHVYDWLLLLLLMGIWIGLVFVPPFERYVDESGIQHLHYPRKTSTVPNYSVPLLALALPFAVIFIAWLVWKEGCDLHHAVLGVAISVFLTAVITETLKVALGMLRPDFYWRCFPPGTVPRFKPNGNVWCTGNPKEIKEGRKSFVSAHASWTFAGLTYLSLYIAGKLEIFGGKGKVWKLLPAVLPMFVAMLVAISRVDDYMHHWQDVTVGGLMGLVIALFVYHQHYPSLTLGGLPRVVMDLNACTVPDSRKVGDAVGGEAAKIDSSEESLADVEMGFGGIRSNSRHTLSRRQSSSLIPEASGVSKENGEIE